MKTFSFEVNGIRFRVKADAEQIIVSNDLDEEVRDMPVDGQWRALAMEVAEEMVENY